MSTIAEIKTLSAYSLAGMADCGAPDNSTSVGAAFLTSVRDEVIEAVQFANEDDTLENAIETVRDDRVHEIADGSPSVYTSTRWAQFVDLAAYQEDISELTSDETSLTDAAGVALYVIAERLALAILEDIDTEEDTEQD